MTPNKPSMSPLIVASALAAGAMPNMGMASSAGPSTDDFFPISNSLFPDLGVDIFRRKPTQVEKIAFPRDQRKRRKNARRANAAGAKNAFNK